MPDVIVISTGDELLYGTTTNTNSSLISSFFFGSNFKVTKHIAIGDETDLIISCIKESIKEADIVITTGGLGPTDDDNTVEAVCRIFQRKIITDEYSREKTNDLFQTMKLSPNKLDIKMSSVPENSIIIKNETGLAPGFIIKHDDGMVISIPGVPGEVENMMRREILPYLKTNYSFDDTMKLTYRMSGIRESDINTMINEIELPVNLKVGITSKSGVCDLTITEIGKDIVLKKNIDYIVNEKFNKYLLKFNSESPEHELVHLLKANNLKISTAESCTGGLIAKRITDIPGSSEVYNGSIIAYSNDVKKHFLDVSDETLYHHGAVSENTALEMASGAKKYFNTDIAISTTGIAGPGGGSELKPVGTVCFGFIINDYHYTTTRIISGSRDRVRTFSSLYAINFLRDFLKN